MCSVCDSPLGRDIIADGGRPHVSFALPTVTYATVFPGRVDPLDNDIARATYLELRANERFSFTLPRAA